MMSWAWVVAVTWMAACTAAAAHSGEQPLSRIAVERTTLAVDGAAHVKASPTVLGLEGQDSGWVELQFFHPDPSGDDWIGVFSPANFSIKSTVSSGIFSMNSMHSDIFWIDPKFRKKSVQMYSLCSIGFEMAKHRI
ncbi:putative inactive purple acid phosphatase 1 [Hordeum vulgare]|nr:putative inactive purple acid phosphatase 1 [Hordeum vulgare]